MTEFSYLRVPHPVDNPLVIVVQKIGACHGIFANTDTKKTNREAIEMLKVMPL